MRNKFFVILIVLLLAGCKKTQQQETLPTTLAIDIEDTSAMQNSVYVKYKIPLPLDLFSFLEKKGVFKPNLLLPTSAKVSFLNDMHKALGLGIYNADLAYCSVLNQGQQALDYFNVSKEIAQDLSIEAGYSDELFDRLNKNLDNMDSIRKIVDEAYWRACNYLEENDKYNILPFVVVGGWFESLYLIANSQSSKVSADEIKSLILRQRSGFKNVQKFLYDAQLETTAYHYYAQLKKIIAQIQAILEIYEKYDISVEKDKPQVYNQLVQKIISYRNQLLNGKL